MPGVVPDLDNCVKVIVDGLNKVAYQDERQVIAATTGQNRQEMPGEDCMDAEEKEYMKFMEGDDPFKENEKVAKE